jgi:hypothetical protein
MYCRNHGFNVVTQKRGVHELVHELDHVIEFRERFGKLPRSRPVLGKRIRDRRLRGVFS